MLISNLMLSIQAHAEKLTTDFVADLKSDPRMTHLARVRHDDLVSAANSTYGRLADWLAQKHPEELEAHFMAGARRQRQAGIPLSEIVYAVILLKKQVWEFVKRNALVDSIGDLYQRDEALILIGEFFDRLLYVTVRGYEEGEVRWKEPVPFS
jgi:hypothetical protein